MVLMVLEALRSQRQHRDRKANSHTHLFIYNFKNLCKFIGVQRKGVIPVHLISSHALIQGNWYISFKNFSFVMMHSTSSLVAIVKYTFFMIVTLFFSRAPGFILPI